MSEQRIVLGDCLDVFRDVRGLQAIVTDPPAGISFMSKKWDSDRGGRSAWIAYWAERFAVTLDACEDNAVGLFWALPRTQHWTACAVEDAGWRIRDVITHHFGQGWPKDKNALKPASEAWILAVKGKPALGIDACRVERGADDWPEDGRPGGVSRKPNASKITGAPPGNGIRCNPAGSWPTNCVFSHADSCQPCGTRKVRGAGVRDHSGERHSAPMGGNGERDDVHAGFTSADGTETVPAYLCAVGCDCGRSWLAESGGEAPRCDCGREAWWACPIAEMDRQSGERPSGGRTGTRNGEGVFGRESQRGKLVNPCASDTGSASRYFPRFTYHAKAPSGERHAGCEDLFWRADKKDPFGFVRVTREEWDALDPKHRAEGNVHPTVKRLSLMRWLHALTGARRIGDLCGGSGSGMVAAYLDGIDWIGAEVCPQAIEIASARLAFWKGLSFEARERFLSDDEMPVAPKVDERQARLF